MTRLLSALVGLLLLAGCTSNQIGGADTGSFVFVSPGGKLEFSYPEDTRKTIGNFTGSSVADPATTLAISDYPDTAVVLNFWGSWCGPCRAEAPDLNVAAALSADRPVQFLGVNVQDSRESAMDFITGKEVTFPSIFDPKMQTLLSVQGFPTTGLPFTIVLDRRHRVAQIFLRAVTAQELDEAIVAVVGADASAAVGPTAAPPGAGVTPSTAVTP